MGVERLGIVELIFSGEVCIPTGRLSARIESAAPREVMAQNVFDGA